MQYGWEDSKRRSDEAFWRRNFDAKDSKYIGYNAPNITIPLNDPLEARSIEQQGFSLRGVATPPVVGLMRFNPYVEKEYKKPNTLYPSSCKHMLLISY